MTTFNGFEPANTTPVPDTLFDVLLSKLSGAELKVMLYIIRRTLGFKKTDDTISLTQFEKGIVTTEGKVLDKGCGLNRETICKALQSLETMGCIKSNKRYTSHKDKDTTLYSIRFSGDEEVVGKSDHVGSRKNGLPVVGKTDYGSRIIPEEVVGKSDLQETVLQETVLQETVLQERDVATATARSQPSSQKEVVDGTTTLLPDRIPDRRHVRSDSHSDNPAHSQQQKEVIDGHVDKHPVVDRDLPARSEQPLPRSDSKRDTNKITEPRKPRTNSTIPQRPRQQGLMDTKPESELPSKPSSKPVEPVAEMAWGTRKCLQWFDYWRGGTLIAKYKLQQAASCAKGLAEQFDEKTVIEIRNDMAEDPYYMQRGGPDICDVANNIHKYLNKKRIKPLKDESNEHRVSSFGTPGFNFADEFYPSEAEKKAYYAAHPIGGVKV